MIESFGVSAAVVYVPDKGNIYRSGIEAPDLDADQLKSIIARGEPMVDSARNLSFTPLKMGVRTVGAIGVAGNLSRQTLAAIGSLIAIAVERANAVETLARSEGAREGESCVRHSRFRNPRVSNSADCHQGLDHQPAVDSGPEPRRSPGVDDRDQRRKRSSEPPGR